MRRTIRFFVTFCVILVSFAVILIAFAFYKGTQKLSASKSEIRVYINEHDSHADISQIDTIQQAELLENKQEDTVVIIVKKE